MKREWLDAYLASKRSEVTIKIELESIAWAGFWIGLGIVFAAGVMSGQVVLK